MTELLTPRQLRITGSCVGAAKQLWEIRAAWKFAPATVSTLCSQLKLTAVSLSQIQTLLLQDSDVLRGKPDLQDAFDTTLTSCLVLSTWLDKYMQNITKGLLEISKATWKTKFKTLWNEHEVKELSGQLQTQQVAISMLVGLLQIDSIYDIRKRLRDQDKLLRTIASNTRTTRQIRRVDAPESIFSANEDCQSVFNQLKDIENDTFDTVLLKSKVYSQAVTGILAPGPNGSDDADTIVQKEDSDPEEIIQSNGLPRDFETEVLTQRWEGLALHDPQIRSSVMMLGIIEVRADPGVEYSAQSPKELSFKQSRRMKIVQKHSDARYEGEIESDRSRTRVSRGYVTRNNVVLLYDLRHPIKMRSSVASTKVSLEGRPIIDKGDIIEVEVSTELMQLDAYSDCKDSF
ncbi:hypothetical protein FB567DRAFT_595068 [Paraphoma chrysanthemicola]|uniref:Uncharacterized protein n=1 Tax=Paraphoma chrysanthemicola TaxID=798071 RepID=A0A8K0VV90_9PLEO|nr:hypothetical protein FB567DRAFT_595068 [Paraphoma chrysanthemicola]